MKKHGHFVVFRSLYALCEIALIVRCPTVFAGEVVVVAHPIGAEIFITERATCGRLKIHLVLRGHYHRRVAFYFLHKALLEFLEHDDELLHGVFPTVDIRFEFSGREAGTYDVKSEPARLVLLVGVGIRVHRALRALRDWGEQALEVGVYDKRGFARVLKIFELDERLVRRWHAGLACGDLGAPTLQMVVQFGLRGETLNTIVAIVFSPSMIMVARAPTKSTEILYPTVVRVALLGVVD